VNGGQAAEFPLRRSDRGACLPAAWRGAPASSFDQR
jgi:hypothetical protein